MHPGWLTAGCPSRDRETFQNHLIDRLLRSQEYESCIELIEGLIDEEVCVGDYLLIHVGYALNKVSEEEAEKTLLLFAEAGLLDEGAA